MNARRTERAENGLLCGLGVLRLRKGLVASLATALVCGQTTPAFAYLKFGVRAGGRQVTVKWAQPTVRYFVSDRVVVPGVTPAQLQTAFARAFATWEAVPTASIAYQFAGFTSAVPGEEDGLATLGFRNRPELERVLAATSFVVDNATGALVESDIFFNSAFQWSTAENGEPNRFDIESIALHEIGHFNGLGHSALGETEMREGGGRRVVAAEAIMFPIAFAAGTIAGRTLRADDIAGVSDLYPDGDFARTTGSVSGRILKDGAPIFGAHVVVFDPARGTMVGGFSLTAQGDFSIEGLFPGPHIIRVEPLDDADIDGFFDSSRNVEINFRVTYNDRLVIVPRAGDSGTVTIGVTPK
jgi:hypothetical protein